MDADRLLLKKKVRIPVNVLLAVYFLYDLFSWAFRAEIKIMYTLF